MQIKNVPKSNKNAKAKVEECGLLHKAEAKNQRTLMIEVQKKPITSVLRGLDVGGEARFPIEQRSSLAATISKLRHDLCRNRWDCVTEENRETFTIKVRRVN